MFLLSDDALLILPMKSEAVITGLPFFELFGIKCDRTGVNFCVSTLAAVGKIIIVVYGSQVSANELRN